MTHRGPFQPLLFCDSVICPPVLGSGWLCTATHRGILPLPRRGQQLRVHDGVEGGQRLVVRAVQDLSDGSQQGQLILRIQAGLALLQGQGQAQGVVGHGTWPWGTLPPPHPCHSQSQPSHHLPHPRVGSHLTQREVLDDGNHRGVEIVLHRPQDLFGLQDGLCIKRR